MELLVSVFLLLPLPPPHLLLHFLPPPLLHLPLQYHLQILIMMHHNSPSSLSYLNARNDLHRPLRSPQGLFSLLLSEHSKSPKISNLIHRFLLLPTFSVWWNSIIKCSLYVLSHLTSSIFAISHQRFLVFSIFLLPRMPLKLSNWKSQNFFPVNQVRTLSRCSNRNLLRLLLLLVIV